MKEIIEKILAAYIPIIILWVFSLLFVFIGLGLICFGVAGLLHLI
jgi:hypothetical protein